jgi:hypothetical protein
VLQSQPSATLTWLEGTVFVIRGGAPTIERWSLMGRALGFITWTPPRVRVREIWSRWRSTELAAMSRPDSRAFYEHFWSDRPPLPEFVPVAEQRHLYAIESGAAAR